MQYRPTRRQLLELSGTAAVVGLAGCTSLGAQPDEGTDTDHHDHTETSSDDGHHEEGGETHGEEDEHHEESSETPQGGHHEEGTETHQGGDEHGHNHDEGMPNEPSETAEVLLATESQEYHFKPHLVWVKPGGTVTWRLESGSHDVVAYHPDNDRPRRIPEEAEPWNSKLLSEEGTTFEYTFETEGVYDYYCTPHESLGMVGTVIVGDPDPHDQPALEEPQSSLPEGARAELEDLAASVDEILGHTH